MKNQCDRCGTCCRQGGPPLHAQDRSLVLSGKLAYDDLVTVRHGEPVLPPLAEKPVPAAAEWIKIQGRDGSWCCRFLDPEANTCTMYADRPVSCRALKCWDTGDILAMAGRELLSRFDLMDDADPLLTLVRLHEESCPVPDLEKVSRALESGEQESVLSELTELVARDLQVRALAVSEFDLSLARELFYFGRPLFQILNPLGIVVSETPAGEIQLLVRQR